MEGFKVYYTVEHHAWNKYWLRIGENYYDTLQEAKKVISEYNKRAQEITVLTKYPTRIIKTTKKKEVVE